MQSDHIAVAPNRRHLQRISLWITVALYTAALPYVILVFRAIEQHFSPQIAGNIPLFIITFLAALYAGVCLKKKAAARCVIILAAGAVVVFLIMKFETNANKYIHIPEYVLMTWILYQALAVDYKGSGILLLIFMCAAMLGIVDELLQGIHPQRTYGWKDMIIDTASSFIGVLTLLGIKHQVTGNWTWLGRLKHFKSFTAAILFGAMTALPMCIYLFDVQAQGRFWKVYPRWLLTGNGLFLAAAGTAVFFLWRSRHTADEVRSESDPEALGNHTTALLWVMCPLTILISIHALVVWVAVAGVTFR
jgi:hypothetical protein